MEERNRISSLALLMVGISIDSETHRIISDETLPAQRRVRTDASKCRFEMIKFSPDEDYYRSDEYIRV